MKRRNLYGGFMLLLAAMLVIGIANAQPGWNKTSVPQPHADGDDYVSLVDTPYYNQALEAWRPGACVGVKAWSVSPFRVQIWDDEGNYSDAYALVDTTDAVRALNLAQAYPCYATFWASLDSVNFQSVGTDTVWYEAYYR